MRKLWWVLAIIGCDEAADPVAQMQPVDAAIVDAATDARVVDMQPTIDMRALDAARRDQGPIDMAPGTDVGADMRPPDMAPVVDMQVADMQLADMQLADVQVADMQLVDMQPPDMALPDRCAQWAAVADGMLVGAVHRSLSESYQPVVPERDRGGNLNRYTTARYAMFTQVERPLRDDGLECVYTARVVRTRPDEEPDHGNLNAEHVWPRSRMEPDRDSALYEHQQSDIHHLYPSDSDANSTRGSSRFGEVVGDRNLDFLPAVEGLNAQGDRVFEPRDERKGDIARAVFYFSIRWGRAIGPTEEATLRNWAQADPVDARERARNDAVERVQGNRNPFTDCPELLPRIADFADFAIVDRGLPLP